MKGKGSSYYNSWSLINGYDPIDLSTMKGCYTHIHICDNIYYYFIYLDHLL